VDAVRKVNVELMHVVIYGVGASIRSEVMLMSSGVLSHHHFRLPWSGGAFL
jgi:hypothetical protein